MITYLKSAFWDYLLCTLAAIALCYTACSGFYATQPLQQPTGIIAMSVLCAVLMAALFALTIRRSFAVGGGIGLAVVLGAILAALAATGAGDSVLDDVVGNRVLFALCVIVPCLLVFLLSRRRMLVVVLGVLGCLFCAVIEYLYFYGHIIAFVLFVVAAVALFAYRTYQQSLLDSDSDALAFGPVTAAGTALALVAVLLGGGVFALAIAPLNPPNVVVKLITEHYRADEIEVRGTGDITQLLNDRLFSSRLSALSIFSSNTDLDQLDAQDNQQAGLGDDTEDSDGSSSGTDVENDQAENEVEGGLGLGVLKWLLPLILGIGALLLLLAVLLKRLLRRRRYNQMLNQSSEGAVRELYRFFVERFDRLKIPAPRNATLAEHAHDFRESFNRFEQGTGTPVFAQLTDVYSKCAYGDKPVSDGELALFDTYYQTFYQRARAYAGRLRYCLLYFLM